MIMGLNGPRPYCSAPFVRVIIRKMHLKVLQWNIWYKENPEKIASEILRINPDIVCAQELMTNDDGGYNSAKIIADIIKYHYVYAEGDTWDNREDKESQGNAIFSRFPIDSTKSTYITSKKHNPKNATLEGRVYLEIQIKLDGNIVDIGTTHLGLSKRFRANKLRLKEYSNLKKILSKKSHRFIFCADLNSTPNGAISRDTRKYLKNCGPSLSIPSWTTKPFEYHGFKEDKLKWRIDYVFSSKDMHVIDSKIQSVSVSDHLPILTTFDL